MSSEFSLTTFNSEGKLKQIENALKAVQNGETCLGLRYKTGVVLIAEKNLKSPLVDHSSVRKLQPIATHVGAAYSGLSGDFRILAQKARKQAVTSELIFEENVSMFSLSRELAKLMQEFTQSGGVRPFGISLLLGGVDATGPHLFQLDPSGVFVEAKAAACGKGGASAKLVLEKRFKEDMDRDDAVNVGLFGLKEGFEGVMSGKNVEIGWVDERDKTFKIMSEKEVGDCLGFIAD